MVTYCGAGDPATASGLAIHLYAANRLMRNRAFYNADSEMLFVPQQGCSQISTEMGIFGLGPEQVALIPRGLRSRVELLDDVARGYICENYGALFRLSDLRPIGSNGLANPRDFETPVAWYEDEEAPYEIVQQFCGGLWTTVQSHSSSGVVAWHGNLAPWRYDLTHLNTINTVSFDRTDPSIFTVLTSPIDTASTANCDFVIFPPRWMVAEDTFRPPWFHRNVMSDLVLHGYLQSSAAYRVRIVLNFKELTYAQVSHDLRSGAQREDDYRDLTRQGLVPANEVESCVNVVSPNIGQAWHDCMI